MLIRLDVVANSSVNTYDRSLTSAKEVMQLPDCACLSVNRISGILRILVWGGRHLNSCLAQIW